MTKLAQERIAAFLKDRCPCGEDWRGVCAAVPYNPKISKNYSSGWSGARRGRVFTNPEHKAARQELYYSVRSVSSSSGWSFFQGPVRLFILVQKPSFVGDAANVLDGVCDAVKEAIGVDDKWFSIGCIDWEIEKDSPNLVVVIAQNVAEDCSVCSKCGLVVPLSGVSSRNICRKCRGIE